MLETQTWPPPPPMNRAAGRPYAIVGAALVIVGCVLAGIGIANVRSSAGAFGTGILGGVAIGFGLLILLYSIVRGRMRV